MRRSRTVLFGSVAIVVLLFYLYANRGSGDSADSLDNELLRQARELQVEVDSSDRIISNLEEQIAQLSRDSHSKSNNNNAQQGAGIPEAVLPVKPKPHIVIDSSERGDQQQMSYELQLQTVSSGVCSLADKPQAATDIQMLDVLNSASFDDIDGGVWKQGFDIKVDHSMWTKEKPLKVFVIPHSHDDPGMFSNRMKARSDMQNRVRANRKDVPASYIGHRHLNIFPSWIKTFDKYYTAQVRHILDNMVAKLQQHEHMKFIYAEISFFSMWWSEASQDKKQTVKRLIEQGRFELVSGGWVMPDEAASHYSSMIDQLIEGHTWIKENVGVRVRPKSGWSIDPFGHTSTMAYILRESGLKNMLIQRVHYSVKKHFALSKQLEFNWRQTWDSTGETDILCHMMPFYSYDVPHTCGPDPKICCQFDFKRLPGSPVTCPWKVNPQVLSDSNIRERASTLLDQYRKKSSLYRSNVLLVPLGDDFRYDQPDEWDNQYHNYRKLFDYMNQQPDWNVKAQFGTLSDYFDELRSTTDGNLESSALSSYPTLSGDFYTYADRADHYWSGYFTSRPFYKHWDRHLESTLRATEIIFTLAQAKAVQSGQSAFPKDDLFFKLTLARRALGLFQHHDGITGTAKKAVVADYGQRLHDAWIAANTVMQRSAEALLSDTYKSSSQDMLRIDVDKQSQDSLEVNVVNRLEKGQRKAFVIYNSHPHERVELVTIWVDSVPVVVYDSDTKPVKCQISPHFVDTTDISNDKFKVSFLAKMAPLGLTTYYLSVGDGETLEDRCSIANVVYYNSRPPANDGVFHPSSGSGSSFSISNSQLDMTFATRTGMATALKNKQSSKEYKLLMDFVYYDSDTGRDHNSGAYLFIPKGDAKVLSDSNPTITVTTGSIYQEVNSHRGSVQHNVRLVNCPGADSLAVQISNIDDIRQQRNFELGMKLTSDIKSSDQSFFTDLNGYTMVKRKYQSKLHLQGNVYPMTSMSYLQNTDTRISLLAAQSAGVLSPAQGELHVILDRRLTQDDNRGMGEPVLDNLVTESSFYLIVEERNSPPLEMAAGYPSMVANVLYRHLVSPPIVMSVHSGTPDHTRHSPLTGPLPCEIHLLNMRSKREIEDGSLSDSSLLLLHHQSTDCSLPAKGLTCTFNDGKVDLPALFSNVKVKSAERRTLTDLDTHHGNEDMKSIQVKPMHIETYHLTLG